MVGADVHEKTIMLKIAVGRGRAWKRVFANNADGRRAMIAHLMENSESYGKAPVLLVYEASSLGFGLYDELTEAGIGCVVVAPTKVVRSMKDRRRKTDERDAELLLELLRGHMLAGNELPAIWVPDAETRDDREIVRARLDVAEKLTIIKAQVRTLLKRQRLEKPMKLGQGWTKGFTAWLRGLAREGSALGYGAARVLGSLLRQMDALEKEIERLDDEVAALAEQARYAKPARALMAVKGVGLHTAMVYLTEMGSLKRFTNRKQIGAYLGLAPASYESGELSDHKGHITHHGPWRVRRVLCQAVWARIRSHPGVQADYGRLVARNPKHKKIAVVAMMRQLAIELWHLGVAA